MDSSTATIIAGCLGGGLVGALIAYFGTYRLTLKQARIAAGNRLRAAFLPELYVLKPKGKISKEDVKDALEAAFERHAIAVAEFRPFIPKKHQCKFDTAWRTYYGYKGDGNDFYLDQYSEFCEESYTTGSSEKQIDRNQRAHDRIKKILEFADF